MNLSDFTWLFDTSGLNWKELSNLLLIAPLKYKSPDHLKCVFSNNRYICFVYDATKLIGAGRALADGLDCSYLCDIAVHPDYQGKGIGKVIVRNLIQQSKGHNKIILYANPGKEDFYAKLGFKKMNTAMAIFENESEMIAKNVISEL